MDAKDPFTSSWVEAKIVKIAKPTKEENTQIEYHVLFQGYSWNRNSFHSILLIN